jgi:hypothetical protein
VKGKTMAGLYQQRLLVRLLALGVLTLCLSLLSRNSSSSALLATPKEPPAVPVQTQSPIVMVQPQMGTPLVVTAARPVSSDPQNLDITFYLTNVSNKPIRVYAIKQEVEAGGTRSYSVSLHNLDLTNSALQPNQSLSDFDTYQVLAGKEHHLTLSVDYVEFSDGTKWGGDSAKSAERTAGQRAAAYVLSKRLLKILSTGNPDDVMSALETNAAKIEPPAGRSDEWKEGFRHGNSVVIGRLKRAQQKGGSLQVERELRQLSGRFKGAD